MSYNKSIADIPMPARIARLPVSPEGFPTPWFVQWFQDGEPSDPGVGIPDFRVVDSRKFRLALSQPRCWVCGDWMGKHRVFTIGPMCAVNRVISEPPSHRECAEYAVKACPFLANPRMRRNEKDLPDQTVHAGGHAIARNPGVMCLWETEQYRMFNAGSGNKGILIRLGDPVRVDWVCQGRAATREEVDASIASGFPLLEELAKKEGPSAIKALAYQRELLDKMHLLPKAA